MQKKKGISLIVLVITIIVMIILAAAIILSLNNAGIIGNANKAVAEINLSQMKDLASMSWGTAYAEGARTLPQLKEKINPEIENAVGEELDNYEVTVGLKGITVVTKKEAPEEWKDSVTIILDGVPIPKGFVASKALGENTRDEGFVIYEKTEGVEEINDENVEWARRNIDQYVWIPVEDFSEFRRGIFRTDLEHELNNPPGTVDACWELLVDENNEIVRNQYVDYADYISQTTEEEAIAMYASVKKYGGFYIARYEMGIGGNKLAGAASAIDKSNIYSQMNKVPYASVTKAEMIDVARNIYVVSDENVGVVSTLTYGVQWDAMLLWMQKRGLDLSNKIDYGNVTEAKAVAKDFNDGAKCYVGSADLEYELVGNQTKESGNLWLMTTGALKRANTYNVYDINGNVFDRVMENYGINDTRIAGSSYLSTKSFRARVYAPTSAYRDSGGRVALYIK